MNKPRELHFQTEADVITDVEALRAGCGACGKWTLPQACWHMAKTITLCLRPPAKLEPSESERRMQETLLRPLLASGVMPSGVGADPMLDPPADAGEADVDAFVARLRDLERYQQSHVAFGPFGPVATADFRRFVLIHADLHLGFFQPGARREGLRFADEDAAIADIEQLRRGYARTGGWTLAQICWHLDKTVNLRMQPGPHPANTPEQDARRPMYEQVMASGKLPKGIVAPDAIVPPADAGDEAIDACIATLRRFKAFAGPVAPHRLFGHMSDADAHKQNLIHVAHHLSHLVPLSSTSQQQPTKQ